MLVFAGDVDGISVFSDDPMDSAICGVIFSPRVLGGIEIYEQKPSVDETIKRLPSCFHARSVSGV